MLKLGVNIDHIATVRQARKAAAPRPLEGALLAEKAGAWGITAHLRTRHCEQRKCTVTESRRRAERNKRIHIRRTVQQRAKAADKEFLIDDHDRRREQQLQESHSRMIALKE